MDQDLPATTNTIKCAEMHINIESGNFTFFCFHCTEAVEINSFAEICTHISSVHFPKFADEPGECSADVAHYIIKEEDTMEFMNMQEIIDCEEIKLEEVIDDGGEEVNNVDSSILVDIQVDILESENVDSKPKAFKCSVCKIYYFDKNSFDSHVKAHDNRPMIFTCEFCPKDYTLRSSFLTHRVKSHRQEYSKLKKSLSKFYPSQPVFLCEICQLQCKNRSSYLTHLRLVHPGTDNVSDDHDLCNLCKICNTHYMYKDSFKNHLKDHQETPMVWHCEYCDKCYEKKSSYIGHRLASHSLQYAKLLEMIDLKSREFNKNEIVQSDRSIVENTVNEIKDVDVEMIERSGKRIFKCKICSIWMETEFYESHKIAHEETHMKWQCEYCYKSYDNITSYRWHRNNKHSTECVTFLQPLITRLKIEQKTKISPKNDDVLPNINKTIEDNRNCSVCGKHFTEYRLLRKHLAIEHLKSKFTKCSLCPATFKTNSNLKVHTLAKHNDDPNKLIFKCEICQKSYSQPSYLQIHKRIHTGDKPYVCSYCGKQFYGQSSLTIHIKQTHLKLRYKCKYCEKKFTKSDVRNSHERRHTNPQLRFSCETCGKTFASRPVLRNHVYLHQEKRYQCKFCDMKFSQSSGRRGHERSVHKAI